MSNKTGRDTRVAIINYKKCQPNKCNKECMSYCPQNQNDKACVELVEIEDISGKNKLKGKINVDLCIGCGICIKKCPFNAITIVKLPEELTDERMLYSYGVNSFRVYQTPSLKTNQVIGLLGSNGLGKSTILKILSGDIKIDLSDSKYHKLISGSELFGYLKKLEKGEISYAYKPQEVLKLGKYKKSVNKQLLKIKAKYLKEFDLNKLKSRTLNQLSGGELQRLSIALVLSQDRDIYLIDEPSAFLDVKQRVIMSREISQLKRTTICIDHDLAILDMTCDFINCLYGETNSYGVISSLYGTFVGINSYLDGYLKKENVKFRPNAIKFKFNNLKKDEEENKFNYPSFEVKYQDFSLTVNSGSFGRNQIIWLLGENGTGKTTMIKRLKDNLEGVIVSLKQQDPYFEEKITVRHYLESKVNRALGDPFFQSNIIKSLKLDNLMDQSLSSLSGGQAQKLSIAECLGKKATVYLLDEPSAYIDVEDRFKIADIIKRFVELKNVTVFLIEHDLLMASSISDRVILFDGNPGKECQALAPQSLKSGLDNFLKNINLTMRRDIKSGRPRINKFNSNKDKEQKKSGKYFYDV